MLPAPLIAIYKIPAEWIEASECTGINSKTKFMKKQQSSVQCFWEVRRGVASHRTDRKKPISPHPPINIARCFVLHIGPALVSTEYHFVIFRF